MHNLIHNNDISPIMSQDYHQAQQDSHEMDIILRPYAGCNIATWHTTLSGYPLQVYSFWSTFTKQIVLGLLNINHVCKCRSVQHVYNLLFKRKVL